jgi:hypothetical protein
MLKIVEERPSEVSHAWKGICALECRPEFMSVS